MSESEVDLFFTNVNSGQLITAEHFFIKVLSLQASLGISDTMLNNMATALCRGHLSRGEIAAAESVSLCASGYTRLILSREVLMAKRRSA